MLTQKLEPPKLIKPKIKVMTLEDEFKLLDQLISDTSISAKTQNHLKDIALQEHWIYLKALKFIAEGCKQPKEIAVEALKVLERKIKR